MVGMLNDVEEGFRAINKAEERVTIAKEGEGQNKQEQIKENIQFIQQRMQQNRELIAKLQQQMRESSFKSSELKRTVGGKGRTAEAAACRTCRQRHTHRRA